MEWAFAGGLFFLSWILSCCFAELKKISGALERMERMDREHHAIMNHIGSDIARNTERS